MSNSSVRCNALGQWEPDIETLCTGKWISSLIIFLTNPIARPVWAQLAMVLNILKNNNHFINTNHL